VAPGPLVARALRNGRDPDAKPSDQLAASASPATPAEMAIWAAFVVIGLEPPRSFADPHC